jgi:hypothetical protein
MEVVLPREAAASKPKKKLLDQVRGRRDVRLQLKSFARWNQSLTRSPQLQPASLRLSAIISQ